MKKKKKEISGNPKKQELTTDSGDPKIPIPACWGDGFFDVVPDLLCIVSSDGYFKQLNSRWEHTLGFTIKELLASPVVVFIHPEDVEHTFREFEKRIASQEILNIDTRYRCKDGSYKWLQWRGKATRDGKEIHAVVREITEWKLGIKELGEKEKRYRTLFVNAPLGYQSLDENGFFTHVNQKWVETFGYSEKEVKGKWFGDFLAPDSVPAFREQYPLFRKNGKIHCEFKMLRKDGANISVACDGSIAYKPTGAFDFANCILQDITESNKTQESLQISEGKLKAVIESTDDAMLILDNSGKSIYSNSKFAGMWGIPTDKLGLGEEEPLMKFLVKRMKDLKKIHDKVKELNQNTLPAIEFVEFSDGRIFELRSHPWILNNEVIGRVLYLRDQTEQIRMENIIKESEERFRFLADFSLNLIFISTNGKIVYVNNRCETITGYSREEFFEAGFNYLKHTPPEYRNLLKEKFQILMSGLSVEPFEYILINKAGNQVVTLLSPKLIQFGGEHAIIGIITDITEQKQAEKVTRQKVESLESYHSLMVGRELKMIELKKEINKLLLLSGKKEKYKIIG